MYLFRLFISIFLSVIISGLSAQETRIGKSTEPHVGQEGKDVIWVPTPEAQVGTMLDIAKVTTEDFLIDLGSGDGRTVIAAAKRGTKARGIEYDSALVALSIKNASREGVSGKAEFIRGDLFQADLSRATVITLFLLPEINLKLRPSLLELKPGTRIVSNSFHMDEWIPDSTLRAEDCLFWCDAFLWIIPAKVGGKWKTSEGELELDQKFQIISGTLKRRKRAKIISNAKLSGNHITFMVKHEKYSGIVNDFKMEGSLISGKKSCKWYAEKKADRSAL
jgi:hypothetical protein